MSALTVETYEALESSVVRAGLDRGAQRPSSRAALRVVRPGEQGSNAGAQATQKRRGNELRLVERGGEGITSASPAQHLHPGAPHTRNSYSYQILQLLREDMLLRTLAVVLVIVSVAAVLAGIGYAFFLSPSEVVTVGAGDSLWSIARSVTEDGNVAETVAKIQNLNNLSGDTIYAGQQLVVPLR